MGVFKSAVHLVTWPVRGLVNGVAGVGRAIAHNKVGAFLLAGAALVGAGFGLKAISDHHEKNKQQEMIGMAPEAGALQQNILANRQKLAKISADLGQYNNPSPNFRESVRGNGIAQGQPDI